MQLQRTVSILLAKVVNPSAVIPSGFNGCLPTNQSTPQPSTSHSASLQPTPTTPTQWLPRSNLSGRSTPQQSTLEQQLQQSSLGPSQGFVTSMAEQIDAEYEQPDDYSPIPSEQNSLEQSRMLTTGGSNNNQSQHTWNYQSQFLPEHGLYAAPGMYACGCMFHLLFIYA